MRDIYWCHYKTYDFPTHTPSAALGAPLQDTTSEEETTHQPAYKIKKPNDKKCTGKLLNYKIPKLTLKQDLTPKPMPSPKKQHKETLTLIEARNQTSEDQQVVRLFEDILNSTSDSGTDECAQPPLEKSRALILFLDTRPTPAQDKPPTTRMLIAEPQRKQVYHPHTELISPIRTGIKATQTIPSIERIHQHERPSHSHIHPLHQERQNPNISAQKQRQHMPDRSRDRHRIIHQKDRHPDIQKPHTRHQSTDWRHNHRSQWRPRRLQNHNELLYITHP